MIKVVESILHDQTVVSVIDTGRRPPSILSLRKGKYSNHEFKCASYHASRKDQLEIAVEFADGRKGASIVDGTLT